MKSWTEQGKKSAARNRTLCAALALILAASLASCKSAGKASPSAAETEPRSAVSEDLAEDEVGNPPESTAPSEAETDFPEEAAAPETELPDEEEKTVENKAENPEQPIVQKPPRPAYDDGGFRVTAYITVGSLENPKSFDASHLSDVTDIILIGDARFDNAGEVTVGGSFVTAVKNICDLTRKLPVRVHASLSGPGSVTDSPDWEQQMNSMAKEHKKAFDSGVLEDNILAFLGKYELDGVFFDYEYPISATAKKQFGQFLVSLRQTLGQDYALGMAVAGWCADFPADAIEAVDLVELMSYDLWDDDGMHATVKIAQNDARKLLDLGYPAEKIDLGIPFYARPTTHEGVWYGYGSFYDQLDGDGLYYESGTGLIHSFNTPDMVYDKTKWAIDQGLGGVMVWHYTCDVPADNEYSLFKSITQAKAEKR